MKKVWVVQRGCAHERQDIAGVFASEADAKNFADKYDQVVLEVTKLDGFEDFERREDFTAEAATFYNQGEEPEAPKP